jgi:hypothetical protein
MPELPIPKTPFEAAKNGMDFLRELQNEDGHFAAEYGGEAGERVAWKIRLMHRTPLLDAGFDHCDARNGPAVQRGRTSGVDPISAAKAPTRGRLGLVNY